MSHMSKYLHLPPTPEDAAPRCGSYPFMWLARDLGLPYGAVLSYVDYADRGVVASHHELEAIRTLTEAKLSLTQRRDIDNTIIAARLRRLGLEPL
jgi:hypothetical protein